MHDVRQALSVGSVVHDRYVVEKVLGRGGFSAVYLVRDQRVQQNLFALKELIDPQKRELERFTFEAEVLRRVDHPSLPRVYSVFEDDENNRAHILMDYIEGPNLEVLRRQQAEKCFSVQQVLSIVGPIMNAVAYLHQQKPPIIHRDIKPANIIVPTSGEEAVLVDFGIAKEFDPESTTTAVRHASPGYGSPEHYATGTNPRTDIYSLGATLYTLLTGHVPVDAFYRATQMAGRGIDPLEPIHNYAPTVPRHIADAIYRAMALDIEKRFPTVQEFWQALTNESPAPIIPASAVAPITLLSQPADLHVQPEPQPHRVPSLPASTTVVNPIARANYRNRRRTGAWLLLLLVLLLGIASAVIFLPALLTRNVGPTTTPTAKVTHSPAATTTRAPTSTATTPAVTATTTPPPTVTTTPGGGYPALSNQYNGTIHNTGSGDTATMSLNPISQHGGNISGNFLVGPPLMGSGPFTGTITTSGVIQFIVHSNQVVEPLFFTGNLQSDESLSGTYCSLNSAGQCDYSNGHGTWTVSPATSVSGS